MTGNPWLSQPDTEPYEGMRPDESTAARTARLADSFPHAALDALAEAERRGAERGWDCGFTEGIVNQERWRATGDSALAINPYRTQSPSEATTAPPEPARPPGDHQDTTEPTGGAQ